MSAFPLKLQNKTIMFPGLPLTPTDDSPFCLNDGHDAFVAVLNTMEGKIYGGYGPNSFVCESCSREVLECPEVCAVCQKKGLPGAVQPVRRFTNFTI